MFQDIWYSAPDWTTNPTAILLLGLTGGVLVAVGLLGLHRAIAKPAAGPYQPASIALDPINMSRFRVFGAGAFGILFTCALVAIVIPAVGISLLTASLLGTLLAVVMIRRRSKLGPMPTSSRHMGANATLGIDEQK